MFKIALDAGHGLNTPGKECIKSLDVNQTKEWWLNNRICNYVESKLKSYSGYELKRMDDRTGKTDVPLEQRTSIANSWGADIYLSVHHNAGVNGGKGGGIIAIVYTTASDTSKLYQKIIYNELINKTGLKGNRANPMPTQNVHVCRETKMPAVLVECGFMDSATDVPIILTEQFAMECAIGLVNALVQIGNLKRVPRKSFADIKGHFAEADINDLVVMGIVNGVSEDKFEPDRPITRAEMAVISRRIIKHITGE